jgi:hypothetical protein
LIASLQTHNPWSWRSKDEWRRQDNSADRHSELHFEGDVRKVYKVIRKKEC